MYCHCPPTHTHTSSCLVSIFSSPGLSTPQASPLSSPCPGSTSVFASPDIKLTWLQLHVGSPPHLVLPLVLLCSFLLPSLINPSPATGWTGNVDKLVSALIVQQIGAEAWRAGLSGRKRNDWRQEANLKGVTHSTKKTEITDKKKHWWPFFRKKGARLWLFCQKKKKVKKTRKPEDHRRCVNATVYKSSWSPDCRMCRTLSKPSICASLVNKPLQKPFQEGLKFCLCSSFYFSAEPC